MRILILGGSGFIGSALAARLAGSGHQITIPTRRREHPGVKPLIMLPGCEVADANLRDQHTLDHLVQQHDVVVNLIGILAGDFSALHVDLPREVAAACAQHQKRLLHMSALNADRGAASEYLRSRGRGEAEVAAVAAATGLKVTVFRPSVVFGAGDNFINMLARLARMFAVIPLGSPDAKFQPVWVEDVARVIATCVDNPDTAGETFTLVGPRIYTLRELATRVIQTLGIPRLVIGLGATLSQMQAIVFEFPPGKWAAGLLGVTLTRDNVKSMSQPNVSDTSFPSRFGQPATLESVLPQMLAPETGRGRYDHYRKH